MIIICDTAFVFIYYISRSQSFRDSIFFSQGSLYGLPTMNEFIQAVQITGISIDCSFDVKNNVQEQAVQSLMV